LKQSTRLYLITAAICIAIGLFVSLRTTAPITTPTAQLAPAVQQLLAETLPDAGGTSQKLSQWQGKILVINFWATWCAPCVNEMPALSSLQAELAGKNIQIIGIGIDSAKNVAEFTAKYSIRYPLYVSGMAGTKFSRAFGNQAGGLPFTVIVTSDGQIHKTYLGQLDIAALRRDLSTL